MGRVTENLPTTAAVAGLSRATLLTINLGAVVAISYLDWLTAAGIVVGVLLGLPILMASLGRSSLDVWITFAAAAIGFVVAAIYGRDPLSPESVWVPNRILAALSIPGTLVLALILHGLRRSAEEAAAEAERSSDLNRLLVSLLAHDLRSPLALAIHTLEYVEREPRTAVATDRALVTDVQARLRRSLSAVDGALRLAEEPSGGDVEARPGAEIAVEIRREVEAFAEQARARGKRLEVDCADPGGVWRVDLRVLRQAVSILVDNAVRHSLRGTIRVHGSLADAVLEVRVADPGPAPGVTSSTARDEDGLGLGLGLCRALVQRAGGRIDVASTQPAGKVFALRLPVTPA